MHGRVYRRQNGDIFWGNVGQGELRKCSFMNVTTHLGQLSTQVKFQFAEVPVSCCPAATNNSVSMVNFQHSEGGAKDTPDFMGF